MYWQDAGGRVVGLAAWQQAWATLDFYVRPGPDAVTVERDIFAWAGGRFRERDAERGHRLPYSVEFRDDDQDRQALAAAHGFVRNVHASHVHLQRQLDALPPLPAVPDGFAIRPLADAAAWRRDEPDDRRAHVDQLGGVHRLRAARGTRVVATVRGPGGWLDYPW